MHFDEIDWSKFPTSNWTIQDTLSLEAAGAIGSLRRYLGRIHRMEQVARDEIEAFKREWETTSHPVADLYGYEPITDEEILTAETDRGIYALLAVAISARVEQWIFDLCDNRKVVCRAKNGKTNLDLARKNLVDAGINCEKLKGFDLYQRAAVLGHKFKHNAGLADSEVFEKYGIPEGQEIEYENEDWSAAIGAVSVYLDQLTKHFQELVK